MTPSAHPTPPLVWYPLAHDCLPAFRRPVLLKLRGTKIPLQTTRPANLPETEGNTALFERGVDYGIVTAVLAYNLDGFGRKYATGFATLALSPSGMVPSGHIAFDKVEAWAAL